MSEVIKIHGYLPKIPKSEVGRFLKNPENKENFPWIFNTMLANYNSGEGSAERRSYIIDWKK